MRAEELKCEMHGARRAFEGSASSISSKKPSRGRNIETSIDFWVYNLLTKYEIQRVLYLCNYQHSAGSLNVEIAFNIAGL